MKLLKLIAGFTLIVLAKADTSGDYCFSSNIGLNGAINTKYGLAPMAPNAMGVQFLLFTCNNTDIPQKFSYLSKANEWRNSNFNLTAITKFIVHGWTETYSEDTWMAVRKHNLFFLFSDIRREFFTYNLQE